MRWSSLFIPTLRESPAGALAPALALMVRAGYIRPSSHGIYHFLAPAQRVIGKIQAIARRQMEAIGAQEVSLVSSVEPAATAGAVASGELRSYKQMPQIWFQFQTSYPELYDRKAGQRRRRQQVNIESFSFDMDAAGREAAARRQSETFSRVLDLCQVACLVAQGDASVEFVAESESGTEQIVVAGDGGYAATLEMAVSLPAPPSIADPDGEPAPEPFHTPGVKTIAELSAFAALPETSLIKSLVMVCGSGPVMVLLRGDHALNETKLARVLGRDDARAAFPDEIRGWLGADAGSLGPLGVTSMPILADLALEGRRNMISGANRDDYHLRHVSPDRDFHHTYHDLRQVAEGDRCRQTGRPLRFASAIQLGSIRHVDCPGFRVRNHEGSEVQPAMGAARLDIRAILRAAVEQHCDNDGIVLPETIAPFTVVITPANIADEAQRCAAESIYRDCLRVGLDALLDDRDERPGVKFKDADLIGIPFRITVGKKLLAGAVELVRRRERSPTEIPVSQAAEKLKEQLDAS